MSGKEREGSLLNRPKDALYYPLRKPQQCNDCAKDRFGLQPSPFTFRHCSPTHQQKFCSNRGGWCKVINLPSHLQIILTLTNSVEKKFDRKHPCAKFLPSALSISQLQTTSILMFASHQGKLFMPLSNRRGDSGAATPNLFYFVEGFD